MGRRLWISSLGRRERGRVSIAVVTTRGNGSWGKESNAVRKAMYSVCVCVCVCVCDVYVMCM